MSGMNSGSFSMAASVTSNVSSSGRKAIRMRFSSNVLVSTCVPVSTANSDVSRCWPSTISSCGTLSAVGQPIWRVPTSAPVSQNMSVPTG